MAPVFDLRIKETDVSLGDISPVAFQKKVWRRLNRVAGASFVVPSDHELINSTESDGRPTLCAGYRTCCITLDETGLFLNGIVWHVEDEGEEDMCYSKVTVLDPRVYWPMRPARDADGDFSDPTFIKDFQTGPQIMQAILDASENAGGGPPTDAEGPLFLDITSGPYEGGGPDLSGAPTNYPMSIAEVDTLMTETGQVDTIIVPTDNGPSELGRVEIYNGDYGTDVSGSVDFDYAQGAFNVRKFRRTEDMATVRNKIWLYLGPRLDLQHWRANVTGTLAAPPGTDLDDRIQASRDELGVYMEVEFQDDQGNESSDRPLWIRYWQLKSWLATQPREMLYFTPIRGDENIGDFDIGDLVGVSTSSRARKASSGIQRVYGYELDIDDDGVVEIGELEVSADQEGVSYS